MKTWLKVLIAFIGSGAQGALTFASGYKPEWSQVFAYVVLAIGGTMSIVIGWPTKEA